MSKFETKMIIDRGPFQLMQIVPSGSEATVVSKIVTNDKITKQEEPQGNNLHIVSKSTARRIYVTNQ